MVSRRTVWVRRWVAEGRWEGVWNVVGISRRTSAGGGGGQLIHLRVFVASRERASLPWEHTDYKQAVETSLVV